MSSIFLAKETGARIAYLIEFLQPGGRIGAVMPALVEELGDQPPPVLAPFWESEFCTWHSPEWWQHHWAKTGLVEVGHASMVEGGWQDWLRFNEATLPFVKGWMVDAAASTKQCLKPTKVRTSGSLKSWPPRSSPPIAGALSPHRRDRALEHSLRRVPVWAGDASDVQTSSRYCRAAVGPKCRAERGAEQRFWACDIECV